MIYLILLASLGAAFSASQPVCPIALVVPMSGPYSEQGPIVQQAVNLAINDAIGVSFSVKIYDSKCASAYAISAIKLAIKVNVSAVIGDLCSGSSLAALPYANAGNMPMISPSATSPVLSIANDYFFRTCPNDNFQGIFLAQYLAKYYARIGIIYGANEAYGEGIAHALSSNLNLNSNVTLIGTVGFLSKDSQGLPLSWTNGTLAGIINGRPNVIVFLTNNPNAVIGATAELRGLGYQGDFAGSDAVSSNPALDGYPSLNGIFGSSLYTGTLAFKNKWVANYGGTVDTVPEIAAQAYDALRVIQKVCVVNGKLQDRKAIFAALNKKGFTVNPAASGTVVFDATGDNSVSKYNILELTNSTWTVRV